MMKCAFVGCPNEIHQGSGVFVMEVVETNPAAITDPSRGDFLKTPVGDTKTRWFCRPCWETVTEGGRSASNKINTILRVLGACPA